MKTPKRDWRKCPLLTAEDRAYLDRAEIGVMFGVERRLIAIVKRLAAAIPQPPKPRKVEK